MKAAVILAGGLGTRLRSAVPDLPKPMAPIAGRPFLEYLMDYWIGQGIERFVLSVGYRHEVIRDHFGGRYQTASIGYAVEDTPLGTGGGVLLAAAALASDAPFLLLNGDTYFAVELPQLERFAMEHDADWCFSLFRANEAGRYMGMSIAPDGRVVALKSNDDQIGRLANGGVYRVNPRALVGWSSTAGENVSLEDDLFASALASGQALYGLECSGAFIDIGIPSDYHRADQVLTP
jgi:D-glycero-alpha-D-manno-heptose 1-phosphate guanylyltransferase